MDLLKEEYKLFCLSCYKPQTLNLLLKSPNSLAMYYFQQVTTIYLEAAEGTQQLDCIAVLLIQMQGLTLSTPTSETFFLPRFSPSSVAAFMGTRLASFTYSY